VNLPQFVGWLGLSAGLLRKLWLNLHDFLEGIGFETACNRLDFWMVDPDFNIGIFARTPVSYLYSTAAF